MLISGGLYLVLSVLVWWNVWSSHPTSTTTCGCGDSSLFTWFLEWPAYAMTHGLNPLFSTAMIYPRGVNLLANTAEVGFGVVLAPITWIFGPVATLNVALTLSPALSALAMFVLLRRWVTWQPAAFFGGLLYGFSPFFLSYLTDAHLMIGAAFVPPLIVACLDELMVRQRRRPIATGVVLGLLVVVQFFIGTEVLAIVIVAAVIATALLVIYAGLRHFDVLRTHVRPAVVGLCSAGVTAGVLLAYPIWFAFAGPAHLSGNLWDNPFLSYGGPNVSAYFVPEAPSGAALATSLRWGGYQGLTLSQQYFGFGMAAVLVLGCIVWRKDRRLWLFGAVGLSGVLLAFGLGIKGWSAWRLFVRFPTMENIIPGRFLLVVYLAVATMLAIILDHAYGGVRDWWQATSSAGPHDVPGIAGGGARRVAAAVGVLLAVIALGPIAAYLSRGLPITTTPVVLPPWFRTVAPTLTGDPVILAFPAPFRLAETTLTWQAVSGMHYSIVGGAGPSSIPQRAGKEKVAQHLIGDYSISSSRSSPDLKQVAEVRSALDEWGVTTIVIPDPTHLPLYEQVSHVRSLVVLLTAATGQRPEWQADAWVWHDVAHAGPPVLSSASALKQCTIGPAIGSPADIDQAGACVLATRSAGR